MPVRFAMIGTGQISHNAAKEIATHEEGVVAAAQDPNAERLAGFCEQFEAKGYATAEEMLAADDIDVVYVAVPNKFHAPLAIQALEAGKHVLMEKPFAINAADAEAVINAAKKAGKDVLVGMNQRYRGDSQKIASLVRQGTLGEVYHAKAYWFRRQGIPKLGTWFGDKSIAGGGCLYDIGVHLLDLCLYCMDNFEPVSVVGKTYTKFGNRGIGEGGWGMSDRAKDYTFDVDDFASAQIRMKNGATVSLDVSWACHTAEKNKMNVDLYGTDAGASVYPARIYRSDPLRDDYDVIDNVRADIPLTHENRFHNFIEHRLGNESLLVTLDQALTVQRILDAIYQSSESGDQVKL